MALAQARLTKLNDEMPASTQQIFEGECRDFLEDVRLFVEAEAANSASKPIGFEVEFGRPLEDDAEPLARSEAVEIDLGNGNTFRIAGRIDRIDRVGRPPSKCSTIRLAVSGSPTGEGFSKAGVRFSPVVFTK